MSQPPSNEEKHSGSSSSRSPAWIAGAVLILIGIVFILRTVSGFTLNNWWALFILIPASGSLATAFTLFKRNNMRFTAASRGPLIGGLVLLTLTVAFLLNLDFGAIWPVFLIIAGAGMVLSSLGRRFRKID